MSPVDYFLDVLLTEEKACLLDRVDRSAIARTVEELVKSGVPLQSLLTTPTSGEASDFMAAMTRCIRDGPPSAILEQGIFRARAGSLPVMAAPSGLGSVRLPTTVDEARTVFLGMPERLLGGAHKVQYPLDLRGAWASVNYGEGRAIASAGDLALTAVSYRRHWTAGDVIGNELRLDDFSGGIDMAGRESDLVWSVHLVSGNQIQLKFGQIKSRIVFDFRVSSQEDLDIVVVEFVKSSRSDLQGVSSTPLPTVGRPPAGPPTTTPVPVGAK